MKQLTMTKVLTPLAALAFAFGVQAAVSTDGFESYAENASVTNATGWSFTAGNDGADDASFVTTYTTAGIAAPASCPDGTTAGSNFLKLSTEDGMLFRNMDGANGGTVQLDAGLYVDTDVQFTITDPSDRPEVTGDDKFIVWLEADGSATNLCVWAREFTVSGDVVSATSNKVYKLVATGANPVDIAAGSWHRLTVKALKEVGDTYTFPAFQVFVDGIQFKASSGEYIVDAAGETAFMGKVGSSVVADQLYFPAMAASMTELTKVGFSGEGALDNVVVTKEVPGFQGPATLTFAWESDAITSVTLTDLSLTLTAPGSVRVDPSAASLTVAIAGTNLANYNWTIDGVAIDNPASFTITPSTKTYTIAATAKDTVAVTFTLDSSWNDYLADISAVMIGDLDVTADIAFGAAVNLKVGTNVTVTVTSDPAAALTLNTSSGNLTVNGANVTVDTFASAAAVSIVRATTAATINGQPYGSFADALSAAATAGTATIALAADATVGNAAIAAGKNITIDLAGHNITGAADAAAVFSVADGGVLTITNSTVAVGVVSKGSATACISNAGTLNLQAGKFDIANGAISGGTINVTGGAYNADTFAGATLPEGMDLAQDTDALDAYAYVLAVDNSVASVAGVKYDTLKEAVEAATAGQTVVVLKDCTVDAPITFNNGIILTNDYTITLAADYALRLANGTTTPVTVCGTGTITWSSGSGSPFLVGNNEANVAGKMNYGITNACTGSLVLESGNLGSTKGSGNMVKVESGSFVMNGGTIDATCTRCVKADAEAGDATATVIINGGIIRNQAGTPIAFNAAQKNAGTATITINGGQITGTVATGTGTVTIPSTSTAQFDRDQTAYCVADYKTVQSGDWYVVAPMEYYTAISLNKASTSLVTNETETLTATLTPASAADDSVTWTSSDATVATVEGGVVTAVGAGTATITAATKNYSATCTVTVTAPAPAGADWVDDSSAIPAGTSAADQYPQLAGTDLATADAKKLTDWAKANSVTFVAAETPTDTIVEAYLLNCAATAEAVATEKAAFKLNITVNGSTVTVSLPDGKTYNGTLQMKGSNDLSTWTNVESASSSYKFYKYSLSL